MVDFTDKFKSLVDKAQQKVSELQSNEKLQSIASQVKETVTEYSEIAQTKLEEHRANSEKKKLESAAAKEKQKFESAADHVSNHKYQNAVDALKTIPTSSDLYEDAQQRIIEYTNAYTVYVLQQSAQMVEQGFYNEAITALKAIHQEADLYEKAQDKISEYTNALETLIKKHKNLVPMLSGNRIVAIAFVDQTVHLVAQIERTRYITNKLGTSTYADGEFLVIRLMVRNDGKKSRSISTSMMNILDSQEREYSTSSKGSTALQMNGDQTVEFLVSEIQPGLQKILTVVFDVPQGSNDLSLKVPSIGWGGSAILPLYLAI